MIFAYHPILLKKKHLVTDKNINNNINNEKKNNNINYLITSNFNGVKTNNNNNISKKSFDNLKGNNYLNNIFSNNSKPILINTDYLRKNPDTSKKKKIIIQIIKIIVIK